LENDVANVQHHLEESNTSIPPTTADLVTAVVVSLSTDAHLGLAEKIAELATEIKTTTNAWVRIRNIIEIGILSVLLTKVASRVSSQVDR